MKKIVKLSLAVAMMSGIGAVNAQAADGVSVLSDVKVNSQIRPRMEMVTQDNASDDATAFTTRVKMVATGKLLDIDGLTATIGATAVDNFDINTYNSTQNGVTKYSVIADPEVAMLNAAAIDYKTGDLAVHLGRSNINLDNQRFIGTVGWRQMDRSYDTVSGSYSKDNLNVLAALVYGYEGVKSTGSVATNSVLVNASYNVMPELKISAYSYMLASIHDTMGVALTGKVDVGAKVSYRAEYAMQGDASMENDAGARNAANTGASTADASYINVDVGANISGILLGVNYESQSGADGSKTAFSTPLGTNHKFNGWADMFLNTPAAGLVDTNVRVGYKAKGIGKVLVKYHMFDAESASETYGSELDVVYVNAIPGVKGLKGLVKYASFTADTDSGMTDTAKTWVGLDYKF